MEAKQVGMEGEEGGCSPPARYDGRRQRRMREDQGGLEEGVQGGCVRGNR